MGRTARAASRRAATVTAGLLVALVALAAPALAEATVTSTAITSPADPYYAIAGSSQPPSITVTGSATGTGSVDVACYDSDDGFTGTAFATLASNVPVSNGTFTTAVTVSDLTNAGGACRLRAVPHTGSPPQTSGLGAFSGPRTFVGDFTATPHDLELQDSQSAAESFYSSFGSCSHAFTVLSDPTPFAHNGPNGFQCAGQVQNPSASSSSRPGVVIDGHPAYPPSQAAHLSGPPSGLPPVTVDSLTQDPSTGDTTLVETDPLDFCSSSTCTPSGVQVQRTTRQTDSGRATYVTDTYSSTDGAAHTVNLLTEFSFDANGGALAYEFPGQSAFVAHGSGDLVTVPATGAQSLFITNPAVPDGSTAAAVGEVTYGQAPSDPFAFSAVNTFDAANTITVSAPGSVAVRFPRATGFSLAGVQQDAAAAQAAFDSAQVAFSSPADGATVGTSPVTVTGTASANSGVRSVTVNGVAAIVAGGSFLVSVPLSPGTNTLTAQVTSNNGITQSASEVVTDAPLVTQAAGALTGRATAVKATTATLRGTVVGGFPSGTFAFQYGTAAAYGRTGPSHALAAGARSSAVSQAITGLTPGTLYHFRLTASNAAGTVTGADATFRTSKAKPRQVLASVSPGRARQAPYRFGLAGRIVAGITARGACAGAVSAVVADGRHTLLRRRARVRASCRYATSLELGAGRLPGHGTLTISVRFLGNQRLSSRSATTLRVGFG